MTAFEPSGPVQPARVFRYEEPAQPPEIAPGQTQGSAPGIVGTVTIDSTAADMRNSTRGMTAWQGRFLTGSLPTPDQYREILNEIGQMGVSYHGTSAAAVPPMVEAEYEVYAKWYHDEACFQWERCFAGLRALPPACPPPPADFIPPNQLWGGPSFNPASPTGR